MLTARFCSLRVLDRRKHERHQSCCSALSMTSLLRLAVFVVPMAALLGACGGTVRIETTDASAGGKSAVEGSNDDQAAGGVVSGYGGKGPIGGTPSGQQDRTVATGGSPPTNHSLPASGGFPDQNDLPSTGGCCAETPSCLGDEIQISGQSACKGNACHSVTTCCSTIWCDRVECIPSCKPGQYPMLGACPSAFGCTEHTQCDQTVACYWTEDAGVVLDSGAVPEDAAACPSYVDCSPTVPPSTPDALCSDMTKCPSTIRAR